MVKDYHLMTVWNEAAFFHKDAPSTIILHSQILANMQEDKYVWWGKISVSGNLGINREDIAEINEMIKQKTQDTFLFLYCPNPPSMHVGKLLEISMEDKSTDVNTPQYYRDIKLQNKIPYWFRICDIDRIPLNKTLKIMLDDKGRNFDVVKANFYPCKVYLCEEKKFFRYKNHYMHLLEGSMMKCFKTGGTCMRKDELEYNPNQIFIGCPFQGVFLNAVNFAIKPILNELNYEPWIASDSFKNIDIMCKVCGAIQSSGRAIIDITQWNANVLFELGLLYGLGKDVLLIKHDEKDSPVDLRGIEYLKYDINDFGGLQDKLRKYLKE